jgi:hypothetical protein
VLLIHVLGYIEYCGLGETFLFWLGIEADTTVVCGRALS